MTRIIHRNPRKSMPVAREGAGCFLIDTNNRRYYDASGGAAVSCLGHGNAEVISAITEQLHKLEYAHTSFFTSEPAEELADTLVNQSPAGLANVYFVSGGSEAMECALKMARQFHVERGEPSRRHIISRRQSYHGNTLGALAIGGHVGRRALYQPLLIDTYRVSPCFPYHEQEDNLSDEDYSARLAQELEDQIVKLGPDTVAAFVAETVVGATAGAVCPVPGYFKKIRDICDRYGVLLILDEVMCGLGRTGTYHAFEPEGVVPDILTLAKGLGGGYQPIGAVIAHDRVVEAIHSGSGAFQHGHTYIGHPVACAAALAVQRIVQRDELVQQSAQLGHDLRTLLTERFGNHPHVGDIRGRGLFQAIELVRERDQRLPFDAQLQLHVRIKQEAHARGLLCYPGGGTIDGERGDHVLLAPPYITNLAELTDAVDILAQAVDAAIAQVHAPIL